MAGRIGHGIAAIVFLARIRDRSLVIGYWLLVIGHWLLITGNRGRAINNEQ
jgi:hypothetical protein